MVAEEWRCPLWSVRSDLLGQLLERHQSTPSARNRLAGSATRTLGTAFFESHLDEVGTSDTWFVGSH